MAASEKSSSEEGEVELRGRSSKAVDFAVVQTVHRQESIHLFFTPFTVQIAGHGSEENDGHCGFLVRRSDGRLLKPLQAPPKGDRELSFYRGLYSPDADAVDLRFRRIVPGFHGTES